MAGIRRFKVILPDMPIPGVSGRLVSLTIEEVTTVEEAMNEAERIIPALKGYLEPKLVQEVQGW